MTPYAKRKIDVTINLATGQFGDDKGQDVTLQGLRVSAAFVAYNGDAQGQLQARIFGMPLSMINQLTTIGNIMTQRRNNRITVTAGDEGGAMATVYEGQILQAYGDFNGAPEVVFNVLALAAAFDSVKPVPPSSYVGSVDAANVMTDLAKLMGITFENNGVSVMLSNAYFSGDAMTQVRECARAARINYTVDRGKLAIWPGSGFRVGDPVPISPATGMMGYPSFSSDGIMVSTLFNPNVQLGGRVNVTSDLTVACGVWNVFKVAHVLESETPNGQWFTQIGCQRGLNA